MKKLGVNAGGYGGEQINIRAVLNEIESLAAANGWAREVFYRAEGFEWVALRKSVPNARRRIYISTGIHGDEPAGPSAVLRLFRENNWPADTDFTICPCLNPAGFTQNKRENSQGLDLNRQYRDTEAGEIMAHKQWLDRQPRFDTCLCLHEDWESSGFYLYQINPEGKPSYAEAMIGAVAKICPIDMASEIEGRPAMGGIIQPVMDPNSRPLWPEALYLVENKTRHNYTLEAPSDFELEVRVNALVAAVRVVLDATHD